MYLGNKEILLHFYDMLHNPFYFSPNAIYFITSMVCPCKKDARGKNSETNHGMDTTGEKEKRKAKKNMDGRNPSGHDNEESRTRSVETQRGMAFSFRKTAAAVIKPDG